MTTPLNLHTRRMNAVPVRCPNCGKRFHKLKDKWCYDCVLVAEIEARLLKAREKR